MLYLHCGWQRTGTSTFQALLAEHQDRLADAGVIYPDQWRPGKSDAHHGIVEILAPDTANDGEIERFTDYLRSNADRTVLISCEGLSNWLPAGRRQLLIKLLHLARDVTPVRCVWTLRRIDSLLTSLYLHRLVTNKPLPPPADFFQGFSELSGEGITTMRIMDDAFSESAYYNCYDSGGAHYDEILRTVGVPDALREEMMETLRRRSRRNVRLGQKGAIALLHTDEVGQMAGVELPRFALRNALRTGKLQLPNDRPCELVEPHLRRAVHEKALEASRNEDFLPYAAFFEGQEVQPTLAGEMDPEAFTDEDLKCLRSWRTGLEV